MNEFQILDSEHTTIEQAYGFRVPGYLIVQPKANSACIADLSLDQATDLVSCIAIAESIISELIRPERVYALKFGEEDPRIHFHVIPRTALIEEKYLAAVPDGKPYSGARIVDWVWLNHLSLGYSDDQIGGFVRSARELAQRDDTTGPATGS